MVTQVNDRDRPEVVSMADASVAKDPTFRTNYVRLEHSNAEHGQYVVINWCFGNTCNFECSYCPAELHDGSRSWMPIERAKAFVDKVISHYGSEKKYFFELTGGEIALYKDFLSLASHIKDRGARVGIISNGSRSFDFWKRARPLLDQVCLSFHSEAADADHYIRIAQYLAETARTHVNIMMHPEKFDFCYEVALRAKDIPNISIALQPLIVDFRDQLYKYTPEQLKILDQQYDLIVKKIKYTKTLEYYRGAMTMAYADGKRIKWAPHLFISSGLNNWQGWDCYAGLEQFVVDMEGNLLRGWCRVGGVFGHIEDSEIQFPTKPVLCDKSSCHCNFDIMTTKIKR